MTIVVDDGQGGGWLCLSLPDKEKVSIFTVTGEPRVASCFFQRAGGVPDNRLGYLI